MKIVECLKCNNHYLEKNKFISECLFCGNKDTTKTIYLSEEGSIYKSIIKNMEEAWQIWQIKKLLNIMDNNG